MSEKPTWQDASSEKDEVAGTAMVVYEKAPVARAEDAEADKQVEAVEGRSNWISTVTADAGEPDVALIVADPVLLAAVADGLQLEGDEIAVPDAGSEGEIIAAESEPALDAAAAQAFAHDELEHGIASVLASLRAEAEEDSGEQESEAAEPLIALEGGSTGEPAETRVGEAQDKPEEADAADAERENALEAPVQSLQHAVPTEGLGPDAANDDGEESGEEESETDFDDAATYRLLGELDRLWHHRAA